MFSESTVRAIVLAASLLVIGGIIAIILFLSVCFVYNWCRRDRDSNWNSSGMYFILFYSDLQLLYIYTIPNNCPDMRGGI